MKIKKLGYLNRALALYMILLTFLHAIMSSYIDVRVFNMSFELEGTDCMPSVNGGYLVIRFEDKEVGMVSVPSPIFADRHRDSINQNFDDFEDDSGNQYSVFVSSSNVGVDWTVTVSNDTDESLLEENLEVEYIANDF